MAKVRWSPEAVETLEEMPLPVARKVYAAVELLGFMPKLGRAPEELRGNRAFPVGRFFIFYEVLEGESIVHILVLQDCRRGDRII